MFYQDGSKRPSHHQYFFYGNTWHPTNRLSDSLRKVKAQARPPHSTQIAPARVDFVEVDGFSEPHGRCADGMG